MVSYLRLLHEPARRRFYPGRSPAQLFPLLTLDQVWSTGPDSQRILVTEIGREAATIVMLGAVALAVAGNAGQWAAAFVIAFWHLGHHVLCVPKGTLGLARILFTWDILFLIPVPWVGPVLAPVLGFCGDDCGGCMAFTARRERAAAISPVEGIQQLKLGRHQHPFPTCCSGVGERRSALTMPSTNQRRL